MPRFVALLRGVNVGKGPRVPMAEFKALLEGLGYTDVRTLLNSGNAVFASTGKAAGKHAAAIATALAQQLGASPPVIVKSAEEWQRIVAACPQAPPEAEHSRYLVALGADAGALQSLAPLQAQVMPPEHFAITPQAAFLHCPQGISKSKLAEALLGKAGRQVTTRNWATVMKLAALLGVAAG